MLTSSVLPTEIGDLKKVVGHDYLTLFTCTPYAVNTHRLLVRGERVPYTPEIAEAAKAAEQPVFKMEPWMWWLIAGALAGLVLLIVIVVLERRRARGRAVVLRHALVSDDGRRGPRWPGGLRGSGGSGGSGGSAGSAGSGARTLHDPARSLPRGGPRRGT